MPLCTVVDCDRSHYAKGMCRPHYQAERRRLHGREDRSSERRKVACASCSKPVQRFVNGNRLPTCSYQCRRDVTWGIPLPDDHWARWYGSSCPWKPPTDEASRPRFVTGSCADCGEHFVADRDSATGNQPAQWIYCSTKCGRRASRRRRRALEHGRPETYRWADLIGLWIKLDRRCAYCRDEIVGQPDPDHVVPLSRGGHNDMTNLLPSCRACNADKNDLTLHEWANDRARRGLPPVDTTWQTYDQRAPRLVLREPERPAWRDRPAS